MARSRWKAHCRRALIAAALARFPLTAGAQQALAAADTLPRIRVTGNDYAFIHLPSTIRAGRTLFSFTNTGKVKHEMSVVLMKPGVTAQEVFQMGPAAASSRAVADQFVGILL